ncbi:aryl-alcohol dehydrogenase-like predicted oxidoreductase [Pseudomonas duriflava]|uniref:Aryl-alcohol dehydrogenase-like predicted oxidoreductase n=1 Tax=Pseudomonas duriflava TaxID=459528 RepID=A0A562QPE1_9PSED|nr:aldo/keto reductase [Pseudomonas duriflava]TWI58543.1 aryl-alcohol dehydrogenase-like predicted oxidoreductase [Pseudomonas duriflava]
MSLRQLGSSELRVSPLAFGGNVFGWTVDEATSFTLLDGLVDAGLNFIDTADTYSRWAPGNKGGESETIIGKWLKKSGKRDHVVIATKVGMEMGDGKKGLRAEYIQRAVDDSLQRLQIDCIDLYQAHIDDTDTPLEETLQAFARLIEQGKVRAIGASNYSAARLREAHEVCQRLGIPTYISQQPHYNLYERKDYETDLEPTVQDLGLGVISYYSLASGFLTGKYRTGDDLKGARSEAVKKYMNERGVTILSALDEIAEERNVTPAQVALAWLIARPSVTAPIASATSLEQLHDLAAATRLTLSDDDITMLNQASAY